MDTLSSSVCMDLVWGLRFVQGIVNRDSLALFGKPHLRICTPQFVVCIKRFEL